MPLTEEQALEFIKRGQAQGIDPATIKRMIESEGGIGSPLGTEMQQIGAAGATAFGENLAKDPGSFVKEVVAPAAATIAAGPAAALGGAAARATLGRAIFPQASGIAGEMAGISAVETGRQALAGEDFDPKKVGIAAGITGAVSTGVLALTRIFGAIGDISRSAQSRIAEKATTPLGLPGALVTSRRMASPRTNAELLAGKSSEFGLVERIRKVLPGLKRGLTQARREKVEFLRAHNNIKLNPNEIADALESTKIGQRAGGTIDPQFALFNRRVDKMAARLRSFGRPDPLTNTSRGLTPLQVDELIREQLAPKSFMASGKPGMTESAKAAEVARQRATELINRELPEDVASLNWQISDEMTLMQQAEAVYGTGIGSDRRLREQFILTIFKEGKAEEIKLLKYIDDRLGTDFTNEAFDLSTRRQFTGFFTTPSEGSGRPVKEALGTGARVGAGFTAPAQRLAGGAAGTALEGGLATYQAFQRAMEKARLQSEQEIAERKKETDKAGF